MANLIYTKGRAQVNENECDWEANVFRVLLERDTSAYTPDIRHDFLDSFTDGGGVEITAPSYTRQSLTNCSIVINDAVDRVELHCDDIMFGRLQAGQTVKAILVYMQMGGDDSTPVDDTLIAYIDTVTGGSLPAALGSGAFNITVHSDGLITVAQG